MPGITLKVIKGASPREADEDAIVSAMIMEHFLGAPLAKSAVISIFPKSLSMKHVAEVRRAACGQKVFCFSVSER